MNRLQMCCYIKKWVWHCDIAHLTQIGDGGGGGGGDDGDGGDGGTYVVNYQLSY